MIKEVIIQKEPAMLDVSEFLLRKIVEPVLAYMTNDILPSRLT
jgi:hypothetical protein